MSSIARRFSSQANTICADISEEHIDDHYGAPASHCFIKRGNVASSHLAKHIRQLPNIVGLLDLSFCLYICHSASRYDDAQRGMRVWFSIFAFIYFFRRRPRSVPSLMTRLGVSFAIGLFIGVLVRISNGIWVCMKASVAILADS
jgi:hypothetical protein